MPNKVIAVVVTFNRLDKLKVCLSALKTHAPQADILVVDNASTDGTGEWLASQVSEPQVNILTEEKNIGGAGGFSDGMRWSVAHDYEFVWIMDDDCFVNEQTLPQLLHADEVLQGDYGWLSSLALWRDGKICKMNRQVLDYLEKQLFDDFGHLLQHSINKSHQATFVSLFVRTSTIREVGLPIKEFFIWGDDVEYTRRIAIRHGKSSYLVGASTVLHDMNSNTGSNIATDGHDRIDRYSYAYRNEGYLWRHEGAHGLCYFVAKCGYNIFKILAHAKDMRIKRCWVVIKNATQGLLFFHPQIEYPTQN